MRAGNRFLPSRSLRTRILLAIAVTVLFLITALILLGVARIRHMLFVQVRHEGLILSDTVEAAVGEFAKAGDARGIQRYIDSFVAHRTKNDIEINVLLLRGDSSEIVASNVPDNIEAADAEEHDAVLRAIASGEPDLEIEFDVGPENEEERRIARDSRHPDFYFRAGSRVLNVTTPLGQAGAPIGGINIKLTLRHVDDALASLTWSGLAALGLGCLVLVFLLTPFLNRKVFRPLERLAAEMYAFGTGVAIGALAPSARRDEIGVLENEFFNMVARINSAEVVRMELEKARAERDKSEMEKKLRQAQKMEALGTLAGGIAHDFNNILTPIIGYTELVMERLAADGLAQEDLGQVSRAALRAQDLVKQILAFCRQTGEEKAPLHLGPIVNETLKLLRASMPANIDIREQLDDGGATVMGNATHMHQIVLNLATNATHAMLEQGGCLDVRLTEADFAKGVAIDGQPPLGPGRYLTLTVADTGAGSAPDVLDRIFEPYFTTKKEGEGTGLGLAMVHGIVADMGGAIVLTTAVGKGTRFDVYLPATNGDAPAPATLPDVSLPRGTERVLIVDDEAPIASMIGQQLGALGYRVTVLSDPMAAVELALKPAEGFAVILSDVAMPGMTGIELAKILAERGNVLPIILCSGYTGGINWRTAGAVGIRAMVMKPIDRAKLAQTVRQVIDGERVSREA